MTRHARPRPVRTAPALVHATTVPHGSVRTFHPRRSALGSARTDALARRWSDLGLSVHDEAVGTGPLAADGTLDTVRLFGRRAPVVLEIGSGMGEAVVAMAAADPVRDYLAVEAHLPGVANLVRVLDEGGPANVRVAHGDALELVRRRLAVDSLDAVHVFFPDPWPKARHHKRRIIAPGHVALLRSRLRPGGTLHCTTDWEPYGRSMLKTLTADPGLHNPHDGYAPRPPHRPVTKFEQRGLDLGHEVVDIVVVRCS